MQRRSRLQSVSTHCRYPHRTRLRQALRRYRSIGRSATRSRRCQAKPAVCWLQRCHYGTARTTRWRAYRSCAPLGISSGVWSRSCASGHAMLSALSSWSVVAIKMSRTRSRVGTLQFRTKHKVTPIHYEPHPKHRAGKATSSHRSMRFTSEQVERVKMLHTFACCATRLRCLCVKPMVLTKHNLLCMAPNRCRTLATSFTSCSAIAKKVSKRLTACSACGSRATRRAVGVAAAHSPALATRGCARGKGEPALSEERQARPPHCTIRTAV